MSLRFLYIGNFDLPFCTEVHLAATLEALGCEVIRAQENRTTLAQLAELVQGADLLLYTRTWNKTRTWQCGGGDFLAFLEALPIPSVSFHLDLYAGLKRGDGLREDPFWRTKYVFSADGGSEEFFRRHGVNHFWLRPGVFHEGCYLAEPREDLRTEVAFVGNSGIRPEDYHPEWPYRPRLVRWLQQTYGRRFRKWPIPGRPAIREHDLNQLYASTKIVVGDSLVLGPEDKRQPAFTHARYWSDRVYETLGRGGFLIMPRIAGLPEELRDNVHLVYYDFGDFAGLRRKIDYYLRPEFEHEREAIRIAGHTFVRENCTYLQRMREMLGVIAERETSIAAKWGG